MAKLLAGTIIGGFQKLGFYTFNNNDSDNSTRYLHFKTNCAVMTDMMVAIEAIGYNYGLAQAIRCTWSWYAYSVIYDPIHVGCNTLYPGIFADSIYVSTDGFVCLRTTGGAKYYVGMTFNAYFGVTGNRANYDNLTITASAINTNPGNHF